MKKILALSLLAAVAKADQIITLGQNEIQAANFIAQCAKELADQNFIVVSGHRSTHIQGLAYAYTLKNSEGKELSLAIRWPKDTRKYECQIVKPR